MSTLYDVILYTVEPFWMVSEAILPRRMYETTVYEPSFVEGSWILKSNVLWSWIHRTLKKFYVQSMLHTTLKKFVVRSMIHTTLKKFVVQSMIHTMLKKFVVWSMIHTTLINIVQSTVYETTVYKSSFVNLLQGSGLVEWIFSMVYETMVHEAPLYEA